MYVEVTTTKEINNELCSDAVTLYKYHMIITSDYTHDI